MGLFGKSKAQKIAEFKEKQSMLNGRELKKLLKMFKENRDEIEKRTGKRPDIDDTTKLFMQKVLNSIYRGNVGFVSGFNLPNVFL